MSLRPGRIASREEIAERLQKLDLDIICQKRIVRELERDGHPAVGAKTLLTLLELARLALAAELGPSS
jgi:hypothetical protein